MVDGIDRAVTVTADSTGQLVLVTLDGLPYTWDPEQAIIIATDVLDAAAAPFESPVRIHLGDLETFEATRSGARAFVAAAATVAVSILDQEDQRGR